MNILFIVQAVPVTIHQAGRLAYSFALAWGVYHCPENWEDSNAKISHLRIHDDYSSMLRLRLQYIHETLSKDCLRQREEACGRRTPTP